MSRTFSDHLFCTGLLWALAAGAAPPQAWAQDHQHAIITPNDTIPGFADVPTIVSVLPGSWSDAATWNPARVPASTDVVVVRHDVRFDAANGQAQIVGVENGGQLRFATSFNTRLTVGTLVVMTGGALEIGTPAEPVQPEVTAEIIIADRALDLTFDPAQWGTGLIVAGGRATMHGAPKAPAFVRTAVEPLAGHTTLQFERAVNGWRPGDQVLLPDTRQVGENDKFNSSYALRFEKMTIQSVGADGRSVTLTAPLAYHHRGARDANGTPTVTADGVKLLPHVANLTRNIVIRSQNPAGTRGHTAYTHRSTVRIAYVQFQDLGRTRAETLHLVTNRLGRYPLHIHHLWGPANAANTGYQFELIGNAVNDSRKWPIAVHGSHFGLVKGNVVFGGAQLTGAGIAVEDGTESENRFEANFVAVIRGNVSPRETGTDGDTPGSGAECFWAAGFNNRFIDNVASTCRNPFQEVVSGPGFKFFVQAAPYTARNPRFRGADMTRTAETVAVTPQYQPLLEFRGNEVYGASAAGFTAWHLGTDGYDLRAMAESRIDDFRVWHVYEAAIWNYPVNNLTINRLVHRIDPAGIFYWEASVQNGDYRSINLTIRDADVQSGGVYGGTEAPLGTIRIENVRAVTYHEAFSFSTPRTPGTQAGVPDPPGITAVLRNNVVTPWPGRSLRTIGTDLSTDPDAYRNVRYQIFVQDYQGQPGSNFQVYWRAQATQNIAGGLAPCTDTTTRPEVDGITCPGGAPPAPPPPPPPVSCVVSAWGAWEPVTSWSACTADQHSRTEERSRTILTHPTGGGAACPALVESRTITVGCGAPPPTDPEICFDTIDNDADGQVDEGCLTRVPGPPGRLTRWVRGSTVNLEWREPVTGGAATGFVVEAGLAPGQTVYRLPMGLDPRLSVPNVGPGKYYVRIRAINAHGSGPASNEVAVSVGCSTLPGQPQSFGALARGNRVSFTWVDSDGCNDTMYRLAVGSAPGASNLADMPIQVETLTGVAPPGTYYARVAAESALGRSTSSTEVALTIGAVSCAAPALQTFMVSQVSGRQVTLLWSPADDDATLAADRVLPLQYVLEAGSAPGASNFGSFILGRTTAFSTAAPPGVYHVRIRPFDACGAGPASADIVVQVQ